MTTVGDAAQEHAERRAERRMRTLKRARIVFNHGQSVFDCTIRNLSPGGALIEVPSMQGMPMQFEIAMGEITERRPCSVQWRTERMMGVRFDDGAKKAA
jgi:hypothetical protein